MTRPPTKFARLPVRARNVLARKNCLSYQDVAKLHRDEFLYEPNFGAVSMAAIEAELAKRGLTFAVPDPAKKLNDEIVASLNARIDNCFQILARLKHDLDILLVHHFQGDEHHILRRKLNGVERDGGQHGRR